MSSTVLDLIYTILLVLVVSTQNSSREPVLILYRTQAFYPMIVIILVSRLKTAPGDDRLSSIQSCTVMDIDRSTLEPLVTETEPPKSEISDAKGIV